MIFRNNSTYYPEAEKRKSIRILCGLSALLFTLFAIVDIWAMPSSLTNALFARAFAVALLGVTFSLTYTSFFKRFHDYIVLATFFGTALSIEYMIYIAKPNEYAFNSYFVGLILIFMTLFSWTYVGIFKSLVVAFVSLSIYVYIELFSRELTLFTYQTVISNLFFIITALVIGFVARMMRDGFLRQNYELQQSLKDSLKEKTAEADDYEYQANHDSLTLLPNRRYMMQLLEESLQTAKEKDKILAILFFDLNGFKPINDVYGHAVGDEVLIIVAKRLELAIRKGDCISRLGGDEYLVGLLIDRDHASDVNTMAAKFTAIISEPMHIDGNIFKVGASVGIAAYPLHGNNVSVLIDIADKKMYKIKQGLQKLAKQRDQNSGLEPVVIFPGNSKSRR